MVNLAGWAYESHSTARVLRNPLFYEKTPIDSDRQMIHYQTAELSPSNKESISGPYIIRLDITYILTRVDDKKE